MQLYGCAKFIFRRQAGEGAGGAAAVDGDECKAATMFFSVSTLWAVNSAVSLWFEFSLEVANILKYIPL